MPLRMRLLDCTIPGLQSSRVSALIRERMRRWYPCRDQRRERTYQAMSQWPWSVELLRCLFAGLSDEEGHNRRGAAAALAEAAPAFQALNLGFAEISEQELLEVDALQGKADKASDLARWSLIVSVAAVTILGFATLALIARSLIKRRASRPAVPV